MQSQITKHPVASSVFILLGSSWSGPLCVYTHPSISVTWRPSFSDCTKQEFEFFFYCAKQLEYTRCLEIHQFFWQFLQGSWIHLYGPCSYNSRDLLDRFVMDLSIQSFPLHSSTRTFQETFVHHHGFCAMYSGSPDFKGEGVLEFLGLVRSIF